VIAHGYAVVTTAGTAVAITPGVRTPTAFLTIYPRIVSGTPNVGQVRIGGQPISPATGIPSGSGMPLSPGDAGVVWPISATCPHDLSTIYVDADNNGDGIQFIWGAP
jgi:hypothetical protein